MTGKTIEYTSSNGVKEQAISLPNIPNGKYSKKDAAKQDKFLAIDFYDSKIALCPKTWSTSPGTMVRDVSKSGISQDTYERSHCSGKTVAPAVDKLAKFKLTMNQHDTSGTFATSSLLYFHFSRYFDTTVHVPTAIYREMDRKAHRDRVTRSGARKTTRGMIAKGWDHLYRAEKTPSTYKPTNELFTPDRSCVYGVLLRGKGTRYGAEVNGIRSRWGVKQNEDFQRTAPYLALQSSRSLLEAIKSGKSKAFRSSTLRKATGDVSEVQMIFWMREITEIVLLDYIFSQQDRIGNIDYRWYWYWAQDGKVKKKAHKGSFNRSKIGSQTPPPEIAPFKPVLIQRTCINDNDAGGRVPYTNFAKKTGMLQKLRHFSKKTYKKLVALDKDLQSKGPIYQYIQANFVLGARQQRQITKNTRLALDILKDTNELGKLKFDLDKPSSYLLKSPV